LEQTPFSRGKLGSAAFTVVLNQNAASIGFAIPPVILIKRGVSLPPILLLLVLDSFLNSKRVSIKRPKKFRWLASDFRLKDFKIQPGYWRKRLFKAVYFYKGKRIAAKNWSVKIQHGGERRTISLRGHDSAKAAKEASRIFQNIVKKGWKNYLQPGGKASTPEDQNTLPDSSHPKQFEKTYWAQKLIFRQHTVHLHPKTKGEYSIRIDHLGAAHYFPLRTKNPKLGASRALQIFQTVVDEGWEKAFAKFPREITLAFRWSDSPLAWTYTTIHTEPGARLKPPRPLHAQSKDKLNVVIAESDAGIRHALISWINRTERFRCVAGFSNATGAIERLKSGGIQLLLSCQNLTSQIETPFVEQLKTVAPGVTCLLYSSYEDSEELFRATPGGSGIYLLKRTLPTKFLEPIEASVKKGNFSPTRMAIEIWSYFKQTLPSLPVTNLDHGATRLTRREHEVLALLGKGFPDKEIADRLHISVWTVNGHVKNIFEKLNVHNRTEAVLKYLQK
jgi:DNA-binding NarL/FixJ family response regulator